MMDLVLQLLDLIGSSCGAAETLKATKLRFHQEFNHNIPEPLASCIIKGHKPTRCHNPL